MLKAIVNSSVRSGDQTILNGDLVVGTAGEGVNFTANTPAAGMTSQLLNWYEEGTWTPALAYTTPGTSAFTYNTQRGYYTRVGRNVTLNCIIRLATFSKGTASGTVTITGIPFTSSGLTDCIAIGNVGLYDAPFTSIPVALISSSSSVISLLQLSSNAGWSSIDDPDADSQYIVSITYTV